MYEKLPAEVLREQICALDKTEDFIFRPVRKNLHANSTAFQCSPMQMTNVRYIHKSLQQGVVMCKEDNVIWNDPPYLTSFTWLCLVYVQLFAEKTTTTLKSSPFFAYPIHAVLLNTSSGKQQWIYNNWIPCRLKFRPQYTLGRGHL